MQTISDRLKQRRSELKLTQSEIGIRAGVSQQTIQQIEAGLISRPRFLFEIANALQCDAAWLLHGNSSNNAA